MHNRLIALIAAAMMVGCATTDKKLDQKIQAEGPAIQNRSDLDKEATSLIASSNDLSKEQKTALLVLRDNTSKRLDQMRKESLKLRSLLVKDMLSSNYNADEVNELKDRMRELEHQKLALIFSTVDNANRVLGHGDIRQKDLILMNFTDAPGGAGGPHAEY